jgi:methyl-accepting chemotaxis protein
MNAPLPTSKYLRTRLALLDLFLPIGAMLLMVLYLLALLDLSRVEWQAFAGVVFGFAVIAAAGVEPLRRRAQKPVMRFLDGEADGSLTPQELRQAFAGVIALPTRSQRMVGGVWGIATVAIPMGLVAVGHSGWGRGFQLFALVAAAASGAGLTAIASFYLSKRELSQVRDAITLRLPDPEERRSLVTPVSLSRKLQLAIAGTVATSLVFAMALSYSRAGRALDDYAVQWQMHAMETIAEAGSEPSVDFDRVLRHTLGAEQLMPFPAEFQILARDQALETPGIDSAEMAASMADDAVAGVYGSDHGENMVRWQDLGEGQVLVSSIPRASLRPGLASLRILLCVVLLVATGIALGISWLVWSDLRQATRALSNAAESMARGDLRRSHVFESEDEMGELARSFERMGSALRATVGRVAEAADRVDTAGGQIAEVAQSVAAASSEQAGRIEQAMELMVRINGQVAEVSNSARALNVSVEESSSSILELGAAGEELNDTASVLSGKVDEVSTSIEEMVRSVKQVRVIGDGLGEAASETSSSMEEMASAMRAVDNTAEITAVLSREVVDSAESGQGKVAQTIDGMQAIRDATDSAEGVIRGLGASTKEIGAILDVIDDVADETNLLALNAAIIAAQAGEHGRAFGVVAEEIKELADRVLASTKEIGGLIRSVQDESSNAVGAIEEGSRSVASGVELSADAGVSLEGITKKARESGTHIGEIVVAVQEQTKAAAHVVELMDRVRTGVDQIASAGAEQDRGNETVYRSAVTMSDVAQQVRRTTEEQSRGFGRIRESVEGVRDAVEQINMSLQEQSSACSQVTEFLEQVVDRTRGNERAAEGMGDAVESLIRQAEALREDVARFQIS